MTAILPLSDFPERFDKRKRWTRADCEQLERFGFLPNRYELIDGEIIEQVGQNRAHIMAVTRLLAWLIAAFGAEYAQSQADIAIEQEDRTYNHPQPDAAVLLRPDYEYANEPEGKDLQLLVEVSDTTLRGDLGVKAALYARAGVPEYWVLDVTSRRLIVHRQPESGEYRDVFARTADEDIATLAAPDKTVYVHDLLAPVTTTGS